MWTTGIAPMCSSGFAINKIVLDRVGWCLNLNCAVQFSHYSFPPFQRWWEWLNQNRLCFRCCLCQPALVFTLAFFRARHLATQFLTLSCLFLHIFLFRQRQVLFPCLLWIMALCTHLILLLTVIFIFTLSTELQMSLSLSFSDCEWCERV